MILDRSSSRDPGSPRRAVGISRRDAIRSLAVLLISVAGVQTEARASWQVGGELETWLEERLGRLDWSGLEPALAAFRNGATRESLAAAVLSGRRGNEPLERLIERAVREDFEAGRVVDLAGWRLARTDARLLALLA